jgi:uncharacterized protein (TIGR03437 family)
VTGAGLGPAAIVQTQPGDDGRYPFSLAGGVNAEVLSAGPAPGLIAGLTEVRIRVPGDIPTGPNPLLLLAEGIPSQPGVTLAVR